MSSAASSIERQPVEFVHTISEAGRLLPSSSRWNSIELEFSLFPRSSSAYDSVPSRFAKSVDYDLVITDIKYFKRFLYISVSVVLLILALILLLLFLPRKNKHHGPSKNLTLAVNQALTFFDAQKSGLYPKNSLVKFRGDSGLQDGNFGSTVHADLVGGFYDSGNNMKFSFPTAYTITLLSWTVIEYHQKYSEIGELDHVKDIIKWGTQYLLKTFIPPANATSDYTRLYSQARPS
ncbi:Glycoside hydrolase [Parasponia andersonii]|uniref:cellulase n=1 Tax=Parasponia andersonii TaxID=3476 RepID=A0A2P5DSM2_PARAD|nr:Glycoside hydrolase [Parasponia andersonii]